MSSSGQDKYFFSKLSNIPSRPQLTLLSSLRVPVCWLTLVYEVFLLQSNIQDDRLLRQFVTWVALTFSLKMANNKKRESWLPARNVHMQVYILNLHGWGKQRLRNEFGHWVFDILRLQSTTSSGIWDCWHRFTLTCWATGSNILSIVFVWKTGILLALGYSPQKLLIFKKLNVCVQSSTLKSEGSDLGHWMNTWSRHHNLVNVVVSYKKILTQLRKKTLF